MSKEQLSNNIRRFRFEAGEMTQQQLADKVVEASAGGGMVTVRINGRQEVMAVKIDPTVIDPDEREMLEDLVVAAVNEAVRRSQELMKDELSKATGVLNIPGLFP